MTQKTVYNITTEMFKFTVDSHWGQDTFMHPVYGFKKLPVGKVFKFSPLAAPKVTTFDFSQQR